MMLSPGYVEPIVPMVNPYTRAWAFASYSVVSSPGSAAWEGADRGVWFPVWVPTGCVAKRMWWANGATVNASYNVEAGIYRDAGYKPGAKLITTGSVAQGTLNQVQFGEITDTAIPPGLWWLYMSCSTTSATFFRGVSNTRQNPFVKFQQASIGPGSAPTTATPAAGSTNQNIYLFGFSTTTIT